MYDYDELDLYSDENFFYQDKEDRDYARYHYYQNRDEYDMDDET